MNFALTREQEFVRQMVREFAETEVKPIAAEIDETERFPMENVEKMAKLGMMGIPIPKEYGGAGGDVLSYIIAVEELSKVCGTTGVIVSAHTSLCASLIYEHGTEEQKQKYLVPLAKGEKIGAFGLTEPNAGTDAAGQQSIAIDMGDHYLLNGSKIFITNGGVADVAVVFAMTDRSKGTRGISAFILEKGMPGFSVGKVEDKMGIRASSTTELIFEDVKVPKENLIGKEGRGFGIAMKTLDGGRIGIASQALGIAEGALEEAITYMKERKQFGRELYKFQGLSWMMADMKVAIESARLLVYQAAWKKQNKLPYSEEAAMAKLHAANVAMDVTTKVVQLFGGYGYTKDYPV
ncbi:acyl-CoA dehydrogenase, partial [Clostridium tetani]